MKLRVTSTVFDGYENVPISWPVPLKVGDQFIDCGPEDAVVVLCVADVDLECPGSCTWNVEHGLTTWMLKYPGPFYKNEVYTVPKTWWDLYVQSSNRGE